MNGTASESAARLYGPPISICVGATRARWLPTLVRAIRRQAWQDWELIVIGQGPLQAELRAALADGSEGDPRIHYEHLGQTGLSRARNRGFELAAASVVAFTDDDCEPRPDWLSAIAGSFASDAALGLVGGAVLPPPRARLGPFSTCPTNLVAEALYEPSDGLLQPPPGWDWMGANFAIRREVAARVGLFDTYLGVGAEFPAGEETDYKLRLEAAGVRMLSTPRAAVVHVGGVRTGLAAWQSQARYASGNGALAAKLTLMEDVRGEEWLRREVGAPVPGWHRDPLHTAVIRRRGRIFGSAYRRCIADFQVSGGLLQRR